MSRNLTLTVNITAVPTSQLEIAVSALNAQIAGGGSRWYKLTTVTNQNTVLGMHTVGGIGGSTGSIVTYSNAFPWNPKNKRIEILAGDHHGSVPAMRFVYYDEATNNWALLIPPPCVPGIGHGFQHATVNPYSGDHYHKTYSANASVYRKTLAASSVSFLSDAPFSATAIMYPTTWWSGSFNGAGAQGCLVIWNESQPGQIVAYDPLTASWFFNQSGKAPNHSSQYNGTIAYSAVKNCVVYGGGNSAATASYRLNADGSFTSMPTAPFSLNVAAALFCVDPVSGNFILYGTPAKEVWELNPSAAGTWTRQTGASRTPPAELPYVSQFTAGAMCVSSLPDHGVIAYIGQAGASAGMFWLYKHA